MDTEIIVQELEYNTGKFPLNAIRSAIEQREAMIPVLLSALQVAADAPAELDRRPSPMLHMYAMYLLAQFRRQLFVAQAHEYVVAEFHRKGFADGLEHEGPW